MTIKDETFRELERAISTSQVLALAVFRYVTGDGKMTDTLEQFDAWVHAEVDVAMNRSNAERKAATVT